MFSCLSLIEESLNEMPLCHTVSIREWNKKLSYLLAFKKNVLKFKGESAWIILIYFSVFTHLYRSARDYAAGRFETSHPFLCITFHNAEKLTTPFKHNSSHTHTHKHLLRRKLLKSINLPLCQRVCRMKSSRKTRGSSESVCDKWQSLFLSCVFCCSSAGRSLQISTAQICWVTLRCTVPPIEARGRAPWSCWGAAPTPLRRTKTVKCKSQRAGSNERLLIFLLFFTWTKGHEQEQNQQ